jgi:hypothetical protein
MAYDPDPTHWNTPYPNTFWPDGSKFQFDLPPSYVMNRSIMDQYMEFEEGGVYDVPRLPKQPFAGGYTGWTTWVDKNQKDYRFAALSDFNSQANIFPEVEDPWMFTEYAYAATTKDSYKDDAATVEKSVIEPPLFNPIALARTISSGNITATTPGFFNDQPATVVPHETQTVYDFEDRWVSDVTAKEYWTSELSCLGWREVTASGYNGHFQKKEPPERRRVIKFGFPKINSNVKLYRRPVWLQATRWGQSQNIPSRVLNMTAPKEFFRPESKFTGRIVPKIKIEWGVPIYDNCTQAKPQKVIRYDYYLAGFGSQNTRIATWVVTPVGTNGDPAATFTYALSPADVKTGDQLPLPREYIEQIKLNNPDYLTDDLIHRGCQFWEGTGGSARCTYYEKFKNDFDAGSATKPSPHGTLCGMYAKPGGGDPTSHDEAKQGYKAAGGLCSYYTPTGVKVVASYEAEATNGAEWANMQRKVPPNYKKHPYETNAGSAMFEIGMTGGGLSAPLGIAMANSVPTPDPFTEGLKKEEFQRVTVEYEPETVSMEAKDTYYDTVDGKPRGKDPESDLRVRAGTGQHAMDWIDMAPYGGVDSIFFSMVNQTNYRMMQKVMHCYRADKCDPIINAPLGNVGWQRGRYSGVNFSTHTLKPPGYPGHDGSEKWCHYGDRRCPYNRLDRRAHEYNENYKILFREILLPFRINGITGFQDKGISEAFLTTGGQIIKLTKAQFDANPAYWNYTCVGVKPEQGLPPLCGHWQPIAKDAANNEYRIFFYYDRPSWDQQHQSSRVMAHIVQFDDDNNPCYIKNIPSGQQAALTAIYGNYAQIPWLVEMDDAYEEPSGNLLEITNSKPFAGGRHPEYKDHSKRGRQIICKSGGYSDRSFAEGRTDSNQFGGPAWNRAPVKGVVKRGYWIDEDGEWILDGRQLGADQPFVEAKPRMRNKPSVYGDRHPIDGKPGLTLQDPEEPKFNRNGDWASVGHTYSNDTNAYLQHLQTIWSAELPLDPNDPEGGKVQIIPPSENDMLPRERYWYRCDKCGIDFPEEEVVYLEGLANPDTTKWYPLPAGYSYDINGARCGCPRGDGGALINQGTWDRFMNTYARGEVDFWGPPGTTVKHDAYVWKSPTMVNRVHHDSILRKLGTYQPRSDGGGYGLSDLNADIEKLGRLPQTTARGYQAGINHQITAPWAAVNESIATIRTRLTSDFDLKATDYVLVQRVGQSNPIKITNETTFMTLAGDILTFWRKDVNDPEPYLLGLPVAATTLPPPIVMTESIVVDDLANHAKPLRSQFENGEQGDRLFVEARRQWLLDVVYGSLQHWSSSIYMQANMLAAQLAEQGKNANMASPVNPSTGANITLDERILAPYGQNDGGGLKMVTMRHLQRLRNRILPMLAYDLTAKTYTAGGDFTDDAQEHHLNRFGRKRRPLPFQKFGTIEPQVMAATQLGRDYYTEWETGDIEGTKARAYYPVGSTWWRMNQRVGQIKRQGGTNPLHLDDPTQKDYTGDVITSTVTYFLHGRIPMHMEVVRAYLVYTPEDAPHMDAIGCQGQYTGNRGTLDFYDPTQINNATYVGHSFCFWQHYHGYTTNHESNKGGYGAGDSYWDIFSKRHAEKHDPQFVQKDDPNLPTLQATFKADLDGYKSFVAGEVEDLFTDRVDIMGKNYVEDNFGWNPEQLFIEDWTWGMPIRFRKTEHERWRDLSYAKYETLIDRYSVHAKAAANSTEAQQTFTYIAAHFRDQIWPHEQQRIPGWFNMYGLDTSNRFAKKLEIEEKREDNSIITLQAESAAPPAGGGNGRDQSGSVAKVLNVTDLIKKLYNDRVDRFFKCKLGVGWDEMFDFVKSKTDTNLALNERFHQNYDDPLYFWNYRYMKIGYGMWLNDPWHHTPVVNDVPAVGNENGDPIAQTAEDREAVVETVTLWDTQGLQDTDPNYKAYHPYSLLAYSPSPFDDTATTSQKPAPLNDDTKYWRVEDGSYTAHSFIMDLRHTPYEYERRSWRHTPPRVDSTNALCPNKSCFVNERGWTVGELLTQSQGTWGIGLIPSTSSEYCANCRTKMTTTDGVLHLAGDGITTVFYDPHFEPDSLISAIEVDTRHPSWHAAENHGFSIDYWNSISMTWRTLIDVSWDDQVNQFLYRQWNGTNWVIQNSATLPTIFRGVEGVNGNPRDPSDGVGAHFTAVAATKLRMRVARPAVISVQEPVSFGTATVNPAQRTIVVPPLDDVPSRYVNRTIYLKTPGGQEEEFLITEVTTGANWTLHVSGEFAAGQNQYQIRYKKYITRCTRFRVFGFPYAKGDIVVTPPGFVNPLMMAKGMTEYRLTNWPSQISGCQFYVGDSIPVTTEEVTSIDPSTFYWEVANDTYDGVTYYKITKAKWFYDYQRNTVVIPGVFKDPADNQLKSIWTLNEEKYLAAQNPLQVKTLPLMGLVEYITGVGVPIDVSVQSHGNGPSYQLDRESVCFILGESSDTISPPVGLSQYDGLPTMGDSVRLANKSGTRLPMKWHVYNHDPLVWKPSVAWLAGDELGAGKWSDSDVMGLFTGNRGSAVSELGPGASIGGPVTGDVTLYGSPNTILSGNVYVYAKAVTTRTYNLPEGGTVTTKERTGGFRSGAFVFRLEVNGSVSGKRTGITCGVPRVLIYMRERGLEEPI